jgi:hypothetical protein
MRAARGAVVMVAGLVSALGLLGCASSAPTTSATTTPTTAATASTTATSTAVASTTTAGPSASTTPSTSSASPTPASTGPSGPSQCTTQQLSGNLGASNGAAGTIYYPLILTNVSNTTCVIQGYPGVSFVAGSNGHQVGAAASRLSGPTPPITLPPGQSTTATLGIVDAGNYPSSCQQTPVLGLRVYPPNQTTSLYVPHTDTACANTADVTLRIYPLAAS